ERIVRIRYATEGLFERDFSYAIDPNYSKESIDYRLTEDELIYRLNVGKVNCIIKKANGKLTFLDDDGRVINEDEKGFHWEEHTQFGGNIVQMSKKVQEGEHYFGLGDKPVHSNMRGKRFMMWGTDEYGFHKGTDPLYKSFPFYVGFHHKKAYGIFFDNTFRSYFDFASERKNATSFWADGGEMNYYYIAGPELVKVVEAYTLLTGTPELPPLWALGYHQCKWSYYPESNVREVCTKFRELQIPCDAIYLDIDYMDGFRCFTWDKEKFPTPKKMISDLKDQGFKTITMIDPGIKKDDEYSVFTEALEKDYFCRRADGPHMKGKVWPGDCYFPDFTKPEVREWWGTLYKEMYNDMDVAGFWNDMNEPAVFEVKSKTFPDDVRHDYDGDPCSHRKAHNIYGMQMVRATYEGLLKLKPDQRPFTITRSCYSGAQRFSLAWTGDNIASWEHLWVANMQCQRMSISGMSFVGSDVGGFIEHPSSELYCRWVQLAVFHPFFRTHSSGDHGDQEPWTFGNDTIEIVRKAIELRYRILPYIYTSFYQYHKFGTPMLQPICFLDQEDRETHSRADEFMLGNHMLSAPVLSPGARSRKMYLPKGRWYDYWTGKAAEGGKEHEILTPADKTILLIKAGAVIPHYPVMQYVGESSIESLSLHVYDVEGSETSFLYEDANDGFGYKNDQYNYKQFDVAGDHATSKITQSNKGSFDPEYATYSIIFHSAGKISSVKVDGNDVDFIKENGICFFKVAKGFDVIEIEK
ncbi:MAG: glycoside hydrolase family 31 protein, partial [Bacteroidota bacterium]